VTILRRKGCPSLEGRGVYPWKDGAAILGRMIFSKNAVLCVNSIEILCFSSIIKFVPCGFPAYRLDFGGACGKNMAQNCVKLLDRQVVFLIIACCLLLAACHHCVRAGGGNPMHTLVSHARPGIPTPVAAA